MTKRVPKKDGRIDVMRQFAEGARGDGDSFFYVRIPANIKPIERGERFEDPLQEALTGQGLGRVTGGGSQLGIGDTIEFCGIDVVVHDRLRGLELIRDVMRRLVAPNGTVIEEFLPVYHEHTL
jgi:hypothetical protein